MSNSSFDVNNGASFDEATITVISSSGGDSFDLALNYNDGVDVDTLDLDSTDIQRFTIPGFDENIEKLGELLSKKDNLLLQYENAEDQNQRNALLSAINSVNDEITSLMDKLTIYQNLQDVTNKIEKLNDKIKRP